MLGVELSRLSVAELKRLAEVTRARGQDALSAAIAAELAARGGRRSFTDPDAFEPGPLSFDPVAPEPVRRPTPPRRRGATVTLAAGAAGALAATLAWGLHVPRTAEPLRTPAPQRVAIALVETPPVQLTPNEVAAATTPPAGAHAANPCYEKPTPAERLLCGYPSLAIADRQLQAAMADARAAGADVQSLDETGWRSRRDQTWDRKELARMYAQRIAEVESAATAARAVEAAVAARPAT